MSQQVDPNQLVKSIDERINERLKGIEEKIASISKQDLGLYGNFTMREIGAMQQKKGLIEKLEGFSASEYGKMTVKELLTGTSNVALPTMVQARALLELKTWIDARDLCMGAPVAKGAGKTVETQVITEPTFSEWTEGSALSAADPTLAKRSITMKPFGKVTQISDLLANTSSVNFVEQIGQVHGSCVRQGIFQYVGVALSAGVGGSLSAAAGSTLTFAEVASAIKALANNGFQADFILTSPSNMWTAFTTNYAVTQFTGALADLFKPGLGQRPHALGLDWYADPYWDTVFPAAQKTLAFVGTKGLSAIWAGLEEDPIVEIYRVPTELGNYIVTHLDGGATYGIANSIEKITYQS
jgi:hypothetical protein